MSRWWRERWHVGFAPSRLCLSVRRAGLRAATQTTVVPVPAGEDDQAQWRATASALQRQVEQSGPGRPVDLAVELSDAFMRYAFVPWSDALRSEREVHAYAHHRVREIYGPAAQAWCLRVSAGAPGEGRIAACVDQALLDGLRDLQAPRKLKLAAVEPHFTAAFERHRRPLDRRGSFWFASSDEGRVVTAAAAGGRWLSIATVRDEGEPARALLALLAREAAALEDDVPRTVVLDGFDDSFVAAALAVSGWEVETALPAREIEGAAA